MHRPLPRVLTHLPKGRLDPVGERFPEIEIVEVPLEGDPAPDIRGEVLLTRPFATPNLVEVLDRGVEWVHTYGTGVDGFPFHQLSGQVLTCSRGGSAIPISEWVLAQMLAFEKRLPETWLEAPPRRWYSAQLGGLHERCLGLVGFGGIAQAVATRALAFGMVVRALRRTRAASPIEGVEIASSLDDLLSESDHVVIAAPATAQTRHLLDDAAFARMKPGAHLVNIARGDLVDQDALRRALAAGQVALASLDAVTPEPLPEGHWMYGDPRVRLSAHVSWVMPGAEAGLIEPFLSNLQRFRDGEELLYRVNVDEGY